ncbi:hypothetical protein PSA7680_02880 [Pseudoruegeria aquimaris]|uniref:Uncharacterized protein n=1 Tax=Pseudoruegeria aquimaris TaxID=393663 RepID=A0A1Y5T374_9RHOB|nr:hypothetical protein [Pseudoruegeria aquimaris]SLN54865.1 hypothetical protein PSA7680_02880 [Pseudoruegeria aquimaris]
MTMISTKTEALRDKTGRFTGQGAFDIDGPALTTRFTPLTQADGELRVALEEADAILAGPGEEQPGVPAVVCRASPGAGKSRLARILLAEKARRGENCNVSFHLPTLALAEEAAAEALDLGLKAQAIRGRSAPRPDGAGTMCAKANLVERASRLGIAVRESFCRRVDEDGEEKRCPHFDQCAYLAQFRAGATHNFLANSYLSLPDPVEKCDLRIVDETFWQQFLSIRDVPVASFTDPRTFFPATMAGDHADLLDAARQVAAALIAGTSPLSLPFSHADYAAFAALEWRGKSPDPTLMPDQCGIQQDKLLKQAEANHHQVSRFAAIWKVLAEAREAGLDATERLRLVSHDDRQLIRVLRRKPLRHQQPMLVLDADADPEILSVLGCNIRDIHDVTLRPNAIVTQLHDRRMTNGSLLSKPGLRETWRQIIAREVLTDRLDRNGGVLVGATRKVVRAFFEDAGHCFEGMSEEEVSAYMLEIKLHGAHWLWFGGRALGSNRYKDCSSVIVIGREELPVCALEDQARALWGDAPGEPLNLLAPDAAGKIRMPEAVVHYEMTDGTPKAVLVPCHPDRRVRRLQLQSRELATRQLIERLRLARSSYPKRVFIGCNIPILGIPVDKLVSWADMLPERVEAAIVDGLLEKGGIRLSASGLAIDAPRIFPSVEAARTYLKRQKKLPPIAAMNLAGRAAFNRVVWVKIKRDVPHARHEAAVLLAKGAAPERAADLLWGPLKYCETLDGNEGAAGQQ